MPINANPYDQGVVLYLTVTAGGAAWNDKRGVALSSTAINNAVWQASTTVSCGRGSNATIRVMGVLGAGQSVKVRVEHQRVDDENLTGYSWASLQTVRGDTGDTEAEHTIVPADLTSTFAGTGAQDLVLQTSSTTTNGLLRVIAKFTNAGAGTDALAVAVEIV